MDVLKKLLPYLLGFCIFALGVETLFLIMNFGKLNTCQKDLANTTLMMGRLDGKCQDIQKNNDQLKNEIEAFQKDNQKLNQAVKDDAAEISNLKEQVLKVNQEKNNEVAAMENRFMCAESPIIVSYRDNASVNNSLKVFVENTKSIDEPITASYWNAIWTGDNYSIHTIEVESEKDQTNYLWKFTAYFDGESYGQHVNGVFWNDQQCWLDIQD